MHTNRRRTARRAILLTVFTVVVIAGSTHLHADTGTCSGNTITLPFTDVAGSPFFCQIAEAFFSALTNGTDASHYSPSTNVTRDQMAAFITRTLDSELRRGSRKASLDQWEQAFFASGATTDVDSGPEFLKSDGVDVWVSNGGAGTISRVRASDGRLLQTWTQAPGAGTLVVARGRIFITGGAENGRLYRIDPKELPQPVTVVTNQLGSFPSGITTDGSFIWVADADVIFKVDPGNGDVTTFTGFDSASGMLYDGSNVWTTEDHNIKKLASNGNVLQTLPVGQLAGHPAFDGANIWVPNDISNSITVIRAKDSRGEPLAQPFVLATLTGNGLDSPVCAAFDGERILVTNLSGDSISLWRATTLQPIDTISTQSGSNPFGACCDGLHFWVALSGTNKVVRF